jgi:hypothetical protein
MEKSVLRCKEHILLYRFLTPDKPVKYSNFVDLGHFSMVEGGKFLPLMNWHNYCCFGSVENKLKLEFWTHGWPKPAA